LNIGINLTEYEAQERNNVLQYIGYSPGAAGRDGDYDHFHGRFRKAIDTGAQKYTDREPGWFYIAAFPFGNTSLYRATWYVNRYGQCVPLCIDQFTARLKERRVKDTNTRIARTRAAVALDALRKLRIAMQSGDLEEYRGIIEELSKDETYGPIMEIVTGNYGVEYAEMMPFIELLLGQPEWALQRVGLTKAMKDIRKSISLRERGVINFADSMSKIVMIRAGVRNPRPQVLTEARNILVSLPDA
jgi:hypothetical protein